MWKSACALCVLLVSCHREAPPVTLATAESAPVVAALDPAGRLPDGVRPLAYQLKLEIAPDHAEFSGHMGIDVQVGHATSAIVLHARELRLTSARVSVPGNAAPQVAQPRSLGESGLTALEFGQAVGPGLAHIEIEYSGSFNPHLRGLYRVEAEGRSYAFTQFEPSNARRAFPCFDEPRFKTPFDVTLRVPAGLTAISNTPVQRQTALASGQTEVVFARSENLPTYLVAFVVGPLDVVEASPLAAAGPRDRALPLRGVAARGRGAELAFALQETAPLVESLERYFDIAYPYAKLDLIAVPDFASGAMENAGAITFRDTLLLLGPAAPEWQRRASVGVNAHELAHQWFGNLVTMPWWDDIWLNEGFATWMAGRVVQEVHPEYRTELTRVLGLERAFDMDSRQSARQVRQPIQSDHDIRNAFDAITYTKGGALLAMFERYLGANAFRAGLHDYLERHRFDTATSSDLLAALEKSSGKPVSRAFSSFLDQPGVPEISAQLTCPAGEAPRVQLRQRRFAPLGSGVDPAAQWQVPVCLRHAAESGATASRRASREQCTLLDAAEVTLPLEQRECPRWLFPNARASGYYRWSLGERDLSALLEHGYAELDAGERLSLLSNSEAAARAGVQSIGALMGVVLEVGKESERELVGASLDVLWRLREALLGEPELPGYQRSVSELVSARQRQLGLFPLPQEDGETKLLRPELVSALAFEARDAGLRRELERLGRARLGLAKDARSDRLSSELVEAALAVAVQEGGKPVIERVIEALSRSNDGLERGRLLGALAANQTPELSPLVLELALADSLRTNERLGLVLGQVNERDTRERSYAWVEEHFDALVARLGTELGAQLTRVAGAFCSVEGARRAEAFLAPRAQKLTGAPRVLRLSLEAVQACAAFASAQRGSAHAYFVRLSPAGTGRQSDPRSADRQLR